MLNTGSRTAATSAIMADSGIGGSGSRARRRTHARGEVCQNPLRPVYGNAMLGQFLEFSFAAQPLAKAFEVYRSLGYRPIDVGDQLRDPYVALSDGTVTVGLHEREQPGPRLTFVRPRLRDYVRGDSLRHVAWKKSASLGRWIIKQTELEAGRAVHVVVDPFKPRGTSDDEFERMISEAATVVFDALRRELDVILSVPHLALHSDRDGGGALFRALALLQPSREAVALPVERTSIIFNVRGADERKTA